MTDNTTTAHSQSDSLFDYLTPYEFIVLTTFRKSGQPMPTTVWFASQDGKLYVTTTSTAGKIKRVRNNGHVLIAPSDRVGNVEGAQVAGTARELPTAEQEKAFSALSHKYGEQFTAIASRRGPDVVRTYIEIAPASE